MVLHLPGVLLRHAGFHRALTYDAATVGDALHQAVAEHPALRPVLFTEDGRLRATHRVVHNGEVVAGDLDRPVGAADDIEIMTAVAGG